MKLTAEAKVEKLTKELSRKRKEVFQLEMRLKRAKGRLALKNLNAGLRMAFLGK